MEVTFLPMYTCFASSKRHCPQQHLHSSRLPLGLLHDVMSSEELSWRPWLPLGLGLSNEAMEKALEKFSSFVFQSCLIEYLSKVPNERTNAIHERPKATQQLSPLYFLLYSRYHDFRSDASYSTSTSPNRLQPL